MSGPRQSRPKYQHIDDDNFYRFVGGVESVGPSDDTGGVPLGAFGLVQAITESGEILMMFLNCDIDGDGKATHVMRDCVKAELAMCDFDCMRCATCKTEILPAPKLCSQCGAAGYCNNSCWSAHWKSGHQAECTYFMEQRSAAKSNAPAAGGAAGGADSRADSGADSGAGSGAGSGVGSRAADGAADGAEAETAKKDDCVDDAVQQLSKQNFDFESAAGGAVGHSAASETLYSTRFGRQTKRQNYKNPQSCRVKLEDDS